MIFLIIPMILILLFRKIAEIHIILLAQPILKRHPEDITDDRTHDLYKRLVGNGKIRPDQINHRIDHANHRRPKLPRP